METSITVSSQSSVLGETVDNKNKRHQGHRSKYLDDYYYGYGFNETQPQPGSTIIDFM